MWQPSAVANMNQVLISTMSGRHGLGLELQQHSAGTAVSATWPASTRALYMPLYIDRPGIVVKLWTFNGATAAGNIDIGLYSDFTTGVFTRLTSSGATAQAGTNVMQEFDIADIAIGPGVYFLGLAESLNTSTFFSRALNTFAAAPLMGVTQEASATLPSTATPAAAAAAYLPLAGIAFRTLVA